MRIILTSVGRSLFEKIENIFALEPAARQEGYFTNVHPRDFSDRIQPLLAAATKQQWPSQPEKFVSYTQVQQQWPDAADYLVDCLCYLWRSECKTSEEEATRRADSPAELASLSLLEPKVGHGDEVRFVYSETTEGAVCSAILAEVFLRLGNRAVAASALCSPGVKVSQQMLNGVQVKSKERLVDEGLHAWVDVLQEAQAHAIAVEDRVLLNITGGYKGLAPLATLFAFCVSVNSKPIEVFYLYEESDQLLTLPGNQLIGFNFDKFDEYERWREIAKMPVDLPFTLPPELGAWGTQPTVGLLRAVGANCYQFTALGELLFLRWKIRQGIKT